MGNKRENPSFKVGDILFIRNDIIHTQISKVQITSIKTHREAVNLGLIHDIDSSTENLTLVDTDSLNTYFYCDNIVYIVDVIEMYCDEELSEDETIKLIKTTEEDSMKENKENISTADLQVIQHVSEFLTELFMRCDINKLDVIIGLFIKHKFDTHIKYINILCDTNNMFIEYNKEGSTIGENAFYRKCIIESIKRNFDL